MGWGNSFGGILDLMWGEPKELAKVEQDANLHGQGFMMDGKHVPLEQLYNNELTDAQHSYMEEAATIERESWDNLKVEANTQNLVQAYANVINRNNVKPTHDPYSNPDAHIYYECSCGAILDPRTKSFAQLNNHASEVGWKVRFGEHHYVPYCVKCGENVE